MLALLGLQDDYSDDGRVLVEQLKGSALPGRSGRTGMPI
jgi:hypothetical protein